MDWFIKDYLSINLQQYKYISKGMTYSKLIDKYGLPRQDKLILEAIDTEVLQTSYYKRDNLVSSCKLDDFLIGNCN